jgi:CheY-like chemotaxis protein
MDKKIHVLNNGLEGLELLETKLFQSNFAPGRVLILLDIKMPKMSGWQFLRAFEDRLPEDIRKIKIQLPSRGLKFYFVFSK